VTGSWQAEAVLVAACGVAIALLVGRGRARARWAAAALLILAVAASLGGLLFAGIAPSVGPAHDAASRLFGTLGFAIVATALLGVGRRYPAWTGIVSAAVLTAVGFAVPLAPVVALASAVACWRSLGADRLRHGVALAAIVAVIVGQLVAAAGGTRLDVLHLTLAFWVLALAVALTPRA
jgi:hypothetical protein